VRAIRPILGAATGASLAAGLDVAIHAFHAGTSAKASLAAVFLAIGIVALPAFAAALVVTLILGDARTRGLLASLPRAVAGGRSPAHFSLGVMLVSACIAGAIAIAGLVVRRTAAHAGGRGTGSFAIVALVLGFTACMLVAMRVGPRLAGLAAPLERRTKLLRLPTTAVALAALFVGLSLLVLAPPGLLLAPAGALVGFVVGDRLALENASVLPLAGLVGGVAAYLAFASVAPLARELVLEEPAAGVLVASARSLADRDGDGYSSILAGGDCDDHNAKIHPGAHDVPGNHVDENCSGEDAKPYVPDPIPPAPRPTSIPTRPNIVLVQLDALRPDHLHFAGYPRATSKNIDRFREHATWFQRAYSPAPSTRYAMPALFTGNAVRRVPEKMMTPLIVELLPTDETFAAKLTAAGYDTVGYTISYVEHHILKVGQGFRAWSTPWQTDDWEGAEPSSATITTDAALKTLAGWPEDGASPFLLFLHYRCMHDPYTTKPAFDVYGSALADRYDAAIAYCDDELGRFLRALDARVDASRTAVVLFSDHGELLGEHGFTNHGYTIYEPDVRSLVLARVPGLAPRTIATPVSLTDLYATVLSLAGLPLPTDRPTRSLLPLAAEGDPAVATKRRIFLLADTYIESVVHRVARGVVQGRWKLVRDDTVGKIELFDLDADPDEKTSLADAMPEVRSAMAEEVETWDASMAHR
jgi:arylsulfatase A-like enzyme